MKKIINTRILVVSAFILSLIFLTAADVTAQRSTRARRAAAAAKNKADLKKGAEDVAIQIKNITKFVFVLGGVARGIEDIDKDVKAGKASRAVAQQNEEFKTNVRASFNGITTGLIKLEADFRTKPALRKYLLDIEGVAARSVGAENFAQAGRFNDGGKELLLVVERLADTLVAMP
ncbi:MAG: hypothetical protein OEM82_05125 [Acidobacteriota bacterium]|nr:hypothetical protein [Acidobacteriota bacterium]MDH3528291.1 hypothetical protein [Acidobacteriota bacterium]